MKRTKDQISKFFWGKKFKDITIGQAQYVNSEYKNPGSLWGIMKKRKSGFYNKK